MGSQEQEHLIERDKKETTASVLTQLVNSWNVGKMNGKLLNVRCLTSTVLNKFDEPYVRGRLKNLGIRLYFEVEEGCLEYSSGPPFRWYHVLFYMCDDSRPVLVLSP